MLQRQRTVLVTGCTPGGIGYATAKEFQSRGFHVIATARKLSLLEEFRDQGMSAVALDVTDSASIAACREEVGKLVGDRLDILVNNAGRGLITPATDISLHDARAVYETNVFGVMAMVSSFINLLIPTQGLIINVASISAIIPYVFGSVYGSSKAALASYSRTLRQELRPFGVRVQVVMAGTVKSNIGSASKGELPNNSLYERVKHLYEARLGFSQKEGSNPMPTDVFARKLVHDALKPEVNLFWRNWFGRPDWFYYGGMSKMLYWTSCLGEWALDSGVYRKFGLGELEAMVKEGRKAEVMKLGSK
ncbi:acylglycerone-phosphate reductase-like protein [Clohesyomyces aquaticus]|uniref:Acylglycerone-phosphate reductase-like protein n=1 Tax=Clohesyomyces aquaticus TaxID=1231657 RepID=A0A1Y1ZTR8_9PLEO|nr:acylglycerone-phosphate reductase-like protein [Clohesyomyces aquaticus]